MWGSEQRSIEKEALFPFHGLFPRYSTMFPPVPIVLPLTRKRNELTISKPVGYRTSQFLSYFLEGSVIILRQIGIFSHWVQLGSFILTLPGLLLTTAVRAYDGTTRTAQGIVLLNLQVGPLVRSTLFHVADILNTYKILLARPWIRANLVAGDWACSTSFRRLEKSEIIYSWSSQTYTYSMLLRPYLLMSCKRQSFQQVLRNPWTVRIEISFVEKMVIRERYIWWHGILSAYQKVWWTWF